MTETVILRPGEPRDSSALAILADAAARRVASSLWGLNAKPGQSWIEIGRTKILSAKTTTIFHANWQVCDVDGHIAGGVCGFAIADPYDPGDVAHLPDFFMPLIEMERVAKGCWNLQVIAVFPEYRGKGLARLLIERACEVARSTGAHRMVLPVESPNTGAIDLYRSCGFTDWERRPFIPFPGSDDSGEWILMVKDL